LVQVVVAEVMVAMVPVEGMEAQVETPHSQELLPVVFRLIL